MKLKKALSLVVAMTFTIFNYGYHRVDYKVNAVDYSNDKLSEERRILNEYELPEAIDYQYANEKGHCERLYDKEPSLNTMVFKNNDGTNSLYYFNYPVKYYDEIGSIHDKSTILVEEEKSNSYISASSDIKTSFSKNLSDGISLEYKDIKIKMLPLFSESDKCVGELSDNSQNVMYDCGDNISLDYKMTYNGFKENIVLDKYDGVTKFDFLLNTNGLNLKMNSDNAIGLYDKKGDIVATVGDIIVYDSNHKTSLGHLSFEEKMVNNQYLISINVDADFFTSTDTVYPVYVDPTIEIDYAHTGIYGINGTPGIVQATFFSDDTAYFNGTMVVGKFDSSKNARSVMKFPGLRYLVNLFEMDRSLITAANVFVRDVGYMSPNNSILVNCHKFNKKWFNPNDLKWSLYSSCFSPTVLSYNIISQINGQSQIPTYTYSFDITSLVKDIWIDSYMSDSYWGTGIMFKASDDIESGNNVKYASFGSFNSVYYAPYLVIDYNDPEDEYRYAENADVSYTYKALLNLTAGKTYKYRTGKATNYGGCDTELYLFKSNMEPGNNSWHNDDISTNNHYSEIEATISSTGTYVLMAKCYTPVQSTVAYSAPTGHCNVYATDPDTNVETLKAEDAVLGGYVLSLYDYNLVGYSNENNIYSSFTANCSQTSTDPIMCVIGTMNSFDNRVLGYNDDYSSTGNHYWGTNSRINQSYNDNKKPIYIFVSAYSPDAIGTCEIYGVYRNALPNIQYIETKFPNLKLDDSIISASSEDAYNCIAYSGGITSMWIDPQLTSQHGNYLSPWYNENNETALDNFYGNNPPRYNGATTYELTTNANEAVINVYKLGNVWKHASVRRPGNDTVHGYAWESKLGNGERIFHDVDSLSGDGLGHNSVYGEVARMYKISIPNRSALSYEESVKNGLSIQKEVILSDSESVALKQKIAEIDNNKELQFYTLYDKWIEYISEDNELKQSNNLFDYLQNSSYEELHNYILNNPEVFYLIARDYYNGYVNKYTNVILGHEFVANNSFSIQIANQIREDNNAISVDSLKGNVYITPSYETNMKEFIKTLLNPDIYELAIA